MNPSDAGIYDRIVVQDIIKEIASAGVITANRYANNNNNNDNNNNNNNDNFLQMNDENNNNSNNNNNGNEICKNFKVVVLNEVDRLTKDAQHGLCRTMEKYMSSCRIILQCESVSKVIEPLRSRCLAIRVSAPSHEEIVNVLQFVAKSERVDLSNEFAKEIALQSNRNLRRALLMLQVYFFSFLFFFVSFFFKNQSIHFL